MWHHPSAADFRGAICDHGIALGSPEYEEGSEMFLYFFKKMHYFINSLSKGESGVATLIQTAV